MFERNEGVLDRIVRVVLGLVLLPAGLFLFGGWQGSVVGLVVAGIGVLGLITGFTGVCIAYKPFGISTLEGEKVLIARFQSIMTDFCQGYATGEHPGVERMCGPCLPTTGETHKHQG